MRDQFNCAFCDQVHILWILLGPEDDLILLKALLLEAGVQPGHVRIGVILQRREALVQELLHLSLLFRLIANELIELELGDVKENGMIICCIKAIYSVFILINWPMQSFRKSFDQPLFELVLIVAIKVLVKIFDANIIYR